MTSLFGVIWFGWPISLAIAATGSAVSLYRRAGHNGRLRKTQATLAAGAVGVFVVPAAAMALGTKIGCSNGDPFFRWRLPGIVLVVLVSAALLGLWRLQCAAGPLDRWWVLPLALLGFTASGFLLESFLTLAVLYEYCDETSSVFLFYVQGAVALIVSAVIVAGAAVKARIDA